MAKKLINGVMIKNLRNIPDERGRLMEIMRNDEEIFSRFGQVYMTTTYPGVVKAWHYHNGQDDHVCCLTGMIKLVLYDTRKDSKTYGLINELFMGDHNLMLVKIPHKVYHGWKCVSDREAMIINLPSEPYNYANPDEVRMDPHENDIPYSWERKDG